MNVRVSLIKYVKQEIIDGLVIIFNKSFREGCFPEVLKIAKVMPIYEGDDAANPGNYKPTSLLFLEKLMYYCYCIIIDLIHFFISIKYCTNTSLDSERITQLQML